MEWRLFQKWIANLATKLLQMEALKSRIVHLLKAECTLIDTSLDNKRKAKFWLSIWLDHHLNNLVSVVCSGVFINRSLGRFGVITVATSACLMAHRAGIFSQRQLYNSSIQDGDEYASFTSLNVSECATSLADLQQFRLDPEIRLETE